MTASTRALSAIVFSVLFLVGLCTALPAQSAQPPAVDSPEIVANNQVMIRIFAPKASEVILRGDWMEGTTVEKLAKGEDGIWSVKVGPLVPDYYSYMLFVDGVKTLDPVNPEIKQGIRGVDNMFFLPGKEASFQENREVPHGTIRQVWYKSKTLGTQRRMHVYTPPTYDAESSSYPVFYLLHGGGDDDSGWSTIGRAGFILDNLLAEGKAKPMIVVMPNGSLPVPADLPRVAPGETPSPEVAAALAASRERFTDELMQEVVPTVEKNFRVMAGREHRALAGLSMGGGQTLGVIAKHPDQFAFVEIWSAGIWRDPEGWEKANLAFLDNPEVNKWIPHLLISVGDKDFALDGAKALDSVFEKHGIKHSMHLSGGGHTWINWRQYLNTMAAKIFQE